MEGQQEQAERARQLYEEFKPAEDGGVDATAASDDASAKNAVVVPEPTAIELARATRPKPVEELTDADFLDADGILATNDLTIEPVYVPEWKGWVAIGVMPADEGLELAKLMRNPANRERGMMELMQRTIVHRVTHKPLFTRAQLQVMQRKS